MPGKPIEPEVVTPETGLATQEDVPIGALIKHALDSNVGIEALERLVALKERIEDRQAAAEFASAMAAFQGQCPSIPKKTTANIVTKSGARYSYIYAELDAIVAQIGPLLQKHGLSFTWDSEELEGKLRCTCKVKHINGHSETATFTCALESANPRMSAQQKSGAALSYARRQSLVQALGLTTCDPDTDGAPTPSSETITEDEQSNILALIEEVGADEEKFLAYLGVDSIDKIYASDYKRAISALERKRRS